MRHAATAAAVALQQHHPPASEALPDPAVQMCMAKLQSIRSNARHTQNAFLEEMKKLQASSFFHFYNLARQQPLTVAVGGLAVGALIVAVIFNVPTIREAVVNHLVTVGATGLSTVGLGAVAIARTFSRWPIVDRMSYEWQKVYSEAERLHFELQLEHHATEPNFDELLPTKLVALMEHYDRVFDLNETTSNRCYAEVCNKLKEWEKNDVQAINQTFGTTISS